MKRYNYDDELATGAVASGGSIGMIMPPSVVLIIYGILTQQSIGALFVAGIFPALLITLLFILCIYIRCTISPEQGPPGESFSWTEKLKSLMGLGETLAVFALVIIGIFVGLFTPTEAAAIGAFGVLLIALVRRQITWQGFVNSVLETLRTSCMVMMLIVGAVILSKFLAVTRIPFEIAGWVAGLDIPAVLVMSVILIIYLIGGCFIDALAFVTLTVPIFYPVVQQLGYDPVWFGVMIVMITQMGVITPPIGINVYVVYGVAQTVFRQNSFSGRADCRRHHSDSVPTDHFVSAQPAVLKSARTRRYVRTDRCWSSNRAFTESTMKCSRFLMLTSEVPASKSRYRRFISGYRALIRFSTPLDTM